MGGRNKLTAEVNGKPLVAHARDLLVGAGVDPVIVVTGHEQAEVVRALRHSAEVIHNAAHADGMGTSLAAGVRALPEVDAFVVALGDMPWVRASTIRSLIDAYGGEAESICIPTYGGTRGNPVLFGSAHAPPLSESRGDTGARHLIKARPECVTEVAVADRGVLDDIDTPQRLRAAIESPSSPFPMTPTEEPQ